jgi:hypothetical protein
MGIPIIILLGVAALLLIGEAAPELFRKRKVAILVYLVLAVSGLFALLRVMS